MAKDDTVIIGAGPAGMATAMELYKANHHFTIIERTGKVGGLARTYKFGDFLTDNGPHRFFSKNKYLYDFIQDLLGESWITVDRFTRFYIDGKFYQYPVDFKQALLTMGPSKAMKVFLDYIKARLFFRREPRNFEDYVVKKFGRTLAEFNMLNYTEKIWGLPCSQLSQEWARQRIRGLSVRALVKNAIFKQKGPKTLVDQFYYPDHGTGLIYETIKKKIETDNDVLLNNEPVKIEHTGTLVTKIHLKDGKTLEPQRLVSSMPITELLKIMDPAPRPEVMDAARNLKFRSQVYLFITINKPSISKDQWIYFPELDVPFGRFSEMKNFSNKMAPADKTGIFVEYFCWQGDDTWNKSKEELLSESLPWFEKLGFFKREEIIDVHHLKARHVYPVYDQEYKKHLAVVKSYLDKFSNLLYIGRPGRFKYTNQDHSLEMGILAARSIIENRHLDIEDVGAENEYFEKGFAKSTS